MRCGVCAYVLNVTCHVSCTVVTRELRQTHKHSVSAQEDAADGPRPRRDATRTRRTFGPTMALPNTYVTSASKIGSFWRPGDTIVPDKPSGYFLNATMAKAAAKPHADCGVPARGAPRAGEDPRGGG